MINYNEEIINGRVLCGSGLCNHVVGKMRLDNVHVLLYSYRVGRLDHAASVSEYDQSGSVTVNRLYDLNNESFVGNQIQPTATAENLAGNQLQSTVAAENPAGIQLQSTVDQNEAISLNMDLGTSQIDVETTIFSTSLSPTFNELNLSGTSSPSSELLNQIVESVIGTKNNETVDLIVPADCDGSFFDLLEEGDLILF